MRRRGRRWRPSGIWYTSAAAALPYTPHRRGLPMNIHEYQAKELISRYGAPVPRGTVAQSVAEAVTAAAGLPGPVWVVKAQIHAGGRGKGKFKEAAAGAQGGVRLAKSPADAKAPAEAMLGKTLITLQTGPAGPNVQRLLT